MVDDDTSRGTSGRTAPHAPTQPATDTPTGLAPTAHDGHEDADTAVDLPARGYQIGEVLGAGGMGEVLIAHDLRIGREVALKRMRSEHPDGAAIARFLREARIQARLDHPAIVPVHELGTDEHGRPFFTMKRLTGVTLAERIADGTPQNRLLRAFVDVCQAIELAHARGVVHRDLKPSNIMLGDYGEVYVLDWGVARVLHDRVRAATAPGDLDTNPGDTQTGALLGTPGYMPPEQIQGLGVTPAADVYALGAILFEILVRAPLHPRGPDGLAHALHEPQVAPSRRTDAAVPPELDQLCHAALAADPAARPTARALADQVQAYLDGDRDVERRRKLAAEQLAAARAALAADDRATAMRTAGRALALDPDSREAAELVTTLIVEPPPVLPVELREQLAARERRAMRARNSRAVAAFASPLLLTPLLPWLDVKGWGWLLACFAAIMLVVGSSMWMARVRQRLDVPVLFGGTLIVAVLLTRIAGPLMLVPVLVCGVTMAFAANPEVRRHRWAIFAWTVAAVTAAPALELAGVFPATLQTTAAGLLTVSSVFHAGVAEHVVVAIANGLFVLVAAMYAWHLGQVGGTAQRDLYVQTWHLRKLVPTLAHD